MTQVKIDSISQKMKDFHAEIAPIKALLGGTSAMREAGETYLPKFPSEANDKEHGDRDYRNRLKQAVLVPYFEDTVKSMTGRLFYKPFSMDLDEKILEYKDDFDMSGGSISGVFESVFYEALSYSRSYIVVDYSLKVQVKSKAEEIKAGARPYAFKVEADQVLDVREKNGKITLFKYQHKVINEDKTNDFEVVYQDEIVLMTPGLTRTWRKSDKGEWIAHENYSVTIAGKALDYVTAFELKLSRKPPLENLAELNIEHWQSKSSQRNIVDTARIPILTFAGVTDASEVEYISGGFSVPKDATVSYTEHSGAAIASGQTSLDKLEEQMGVAGAKLLTRTKMALTDTQAKSEGIKEVSELMLYGMLLGEFMNQVIEMFGMWLGIEEPGTIDITENLKNTIDSGVSAQDVIQSAVHGITSYRTAYETLVAMNAISGSRTYEEEEEQIGIESETRLPRPTSLFSGMED